MVACSLVPCLHGVFLCAPGLILPGFSPSAGKWFVSTGKDNLLNAWRTPYGASIFQVGGSIDWVCSRNNVHRQPLEGGRAGRPLAPLSDENPTWGIDPAPLPIQAMASSPFHILLILFQHCGQLFPPPPPPLQSPSRVRPVMKPPWLQGSLSLSLSLTHPSSAPCFAVQGVVVSAQLRHLR